MDIPEGWTFNPSNFTHRRRAAVFAGVAFLVSLYMALYQLDVIHHIWDPLFGQGSDHVLKSKISKAFPIPDALIATVLYLLELILLFRGGERRWFDSPLLTLASVGLGVALAFGSVILFILQPVAVGTFCTPCLVVLLMALLMVQRVVVEGFAAVQTYVQRFSENDLNIISTPRREIVSPWNEGISVTWPLMASILIAIASLFLPALFSVSEVAKINISICAALTIACSFVAMTEPLRRLRLASCFAGMIFICWFVGEPSDASRWIAFGIGLALIGLNLHAGHIYGRYGIWK